MKFCPKCGTEKQRDEFNKDSSTGDGLQGRCRECQREHSRKYYKGNKQKFATRRRAYYHKNSEKEKTQSAEYYQKHAKTVKQIQRQYREQNSDTVRATRRQYREQNSDTVRATTRRYRKQHSAEINDRNHQRRARMRESAYESVDRKIVYRRDKGRCHLCRKFVASCKFHLDHVIPLSKGGGHLYDNVKVACPDCNLKKSNKLMEVA